jgi:hypothetical protein
MAGSDLLHNPQVQERHNESDADLVIDDLESVNVWKPQGLKNRGASRYWNVRDSSAIATCGSGRQSNGLEGIDEPGIKQDEPNLKRVEL